MRTRLYNKCLKHELLLTMEHFQMIMPANFISQKKQELAT